jgi:hypothetical protein
MPILLNMNGKEPFDFIKPESDNNAFASDVDMTYPMIYVISVMPMYLLSLLYVIVRCIEKLRIVMIA